MTKWKVLSEELLYTAGFFNLKKQSCELPDGRVMPAYYSLNFSDWVHVIALTEEHKVVMIQQYRHAAGETFLEVPGGAMDPRSQESAETAGLRELAEETGYVPQKTLFLGSHFPNPALQTNQMHSFLALGCRLQAEQNLDQFEDIKVQLMEISDLEKLVVSGKIRHSLMLATLILALPYLKNTEALMDGKPSGA